MVGSFLNVVIYRLPVMLEKEWQTEARLILDLAQEQPSPELAPSTFNLISPASRCPRCQHKIRWYENIPVFSWLALKGKCSQCSAAISARYPTIELTTGLASALLAWHFGYSVWLAATLLATYFLIAMAMIDFDTTLLPDQLTLPLMWAGILVALLGKGPVSLNDAIIGAMAGYLSLWSVYWLFKLLTKKEGMGYGDFKLLAALGAWLGWQLLPLVIVLSSAVGAVAGGLFLLVGKTERGQAIPFGPFLAAAGWIALLWGNMIVTSYLGLFKF